MYTKKDIKRELRELRGYAEDIRSDVSHMKCILLQGEDSAVRRLRVLEERFAALLDYLEVTIQRERGWTVLDTKPLGPAD